MTRTILTVLACTVLVHAQSTGGVDGAYHFTTPQTQQSLQEAATIVRTVAAIPQVSIDAAQSSMTFHGPADAVTLASWILPQIDKSTGDDAVHEYPLRSGNVARVRFVPNASTPQNMQELLTIVRTVDDVQKIFNYSPNHAIVFEGPEWQVSFADWIIDQLNQPPQPRADTTPHEFTIGGPDFRGMGHGARMNVVANVTAPRQMQELLTTLRAVGGITKVFSYTSGHAFVLRAGDTDLARAEWLIQQLDKPAGQPAGSQTFSTPQSDDLTRVFFLSNATAEGLHTAVSGIRSDLGLQKVFSTSQPSAIIVRGTTDQIGAVTQWMASHNALAD